ncbi:MAG: hypothetical protein QOJ57_1597 [Thermoleophilaceae bacterium]|nr:hypothetical protein [Thermoleophilaceae bacterium]
MRGPISRFRSVRAASLERRHDREAAVLLARAFSNDPIWRAIGPQHPRHRFIVSMLFHYGELKIARRQRAWVLGAFEGDELRGVLIAYRPEKLATPFLSWLPKVVAFTIAGPIAAYRGATMWSRLSALHPDETHVYGWLLAAVPPDRGVGSLLLEDFFRDVDAHGWPVYIEATHPDNVRLYRRMGWEPIGEFVLRTGDTVYPMWRPGGGQADGAGVGAGAKVVGAGA